MEGSNPLAPQSIGRRTLLIGTAAALVTAACGGNDDDDQSDTERQRRAAPSTMTRPRRDGLALRGMNYDTDREFWNPAYVPGEIATIKDDLNSNGVILLGSELDRLLLSASAAADLGLSVWFEPRHFDATTADTLDFVSTVAREADKLRADHPDVAVSMGVELTLFMDSLVPGNDWTERGQSLGTANPAEYNAKLNEFLADALAMVRPIFGGQLTYSSGTWESVDWSGFDVVGVDMYRDAENKATFVQDVRDLHRHGKPVVITEFGCCSYQGADDMGGSGFMAIDWWAAPPVIADDLVRDEQVQAGYIDELLDIFEAEGVHGAFIYDFIDPESAHSDDPRQDFDMASFAVVKCYPSGHELAYDTTGHYEPKAAFRTIAERFA